jgi:hypothetical protein
MTAKDGVETTIARTRHAFIVTDATEILFKDWGAGQREQGSNQHGPAGLHQGGA